MNKCIVCECANIINYNPPKERPPMKCPMCGRDTRNYITLRADDPRVDKLVEKYRKRSGVLSNKPEHGGKEHIDADGRLGEVISNTETGSAEEVEGSGEARRVGDVEENREIGKAGNEEKDKEVRATHGKYRLVNEVKGYSISIPDSGGVVGRTAIGAEELADNQRISRAHAKVVPAKRADGIMIEDTSANGTFINGRRLVKNKAVFAVIGTKITMGGETFIVES